VFGAPPDECRDQAGPTGLMAHFVGSHAAFAKLPAPRPEPVAWPTFVSDLARQVTFKTLGTLPDSPGWFDRGQIDPVLINLLKNAHEAGGTVAGWNSRSFAPATNSASRRVIGTAAGCA
jgi:hypothetical protein